MTNDFLEDGAQFIETIANRDTLVTMAGLTGGLILRDLVDLFTDDLNVYDKFALHAVPIYYTLRGCAGNLEMYFSSLRILDRDYLDDFVHDVESFGRETSRMGLAGLSLHFTGEYFQSLTFGFSSLFDDLYTSLPYLTFNIPGLYLVGKACSYILRNSRRFRGDTEGD